MRDEADGSVAIRFGNVADVEDLIRISQAIWDDSSAMLRDAGLHDRPTAVDLRAKIAPIIGDILVATLAGTVVGFCYRQKAEIEDLWVDPPHQGEGVGLTLMTHALSLMRAEGRETALLECLEANLRARRFYEREGWRQTSRFIRRRGHLEYAMVAFEKEI